MQGLWEKFCESERNIKMSEIWHVSRVDESGEASNITTHESEKEARLQLYEMLTFGPAGLFQYGAVYTVTKDGE